MQRPTECSGCTRAIDVSFRSIDAKGQCCQSLGMCAECPQLRERLWQDDTPSASTTLGKGVCCSTCGLSLCSVVQEGSVGCPDCYHVFGDAILDEMRARKWLQGDLIPGAILPQQPDPQSTMRLAVLNEALEKAVAGENYEQAAWLRDQILALKKEHGASS